MNRTEALTSRIYYLTIDMINNLIILSTFI